MSFFAPLAGPLWKQLEGYGIDPAGVFKEAGVDPECIYDSNARIPAAAFETLFDLAINASGDPFFGLREQQYFRPAHLGALGFAWLASTSLHTAFERMSRYTKFFSGILTVGLHENESNLVVCFQSNSGTRHKDIREDSQLALTTKCCRVIAGDRFRAARILFTQKEPADTSYHYELFRCPLEFEAPETAMWIPLDQANMRLTGSNSELANLNEHIVVKYLAHAAKNDVVNRVKANIIDSLSSGNVTETLVADRLHMTPRNLHRKLAREGTSFKHLLNEVRQELAHQYIHDRTITLTEISFMLGFSEVSSFSRAYKNWTGKPPSAVRQAMTGEA